MKLELSSIGRRLFAAVEEDRRLVWGLAVALSVRLFLLPFFSDPLNFYGIGLTVSLLDAGQNPWVAIRADPALSRFNPWGYPPSALLPVQAAASLSFGNGYLFGILVRLPLIACDLLTAVYFFRIARTLGATTDKARRLSFAYAFNPFVIFVSTVWGTNDPFPVLFVAMACYYLLRPSPRYDLSALCLGMGIAFKIYPLVFLPLALAVVPGWKPRLRYLLFAAIPGVITTGPVLLTSPDEFLGTIGAFTTGIGEGPVALNLSPWWVLADGFRIINTTAITVGIVLYVVLILVLAVYVARGRVSFLRAATVVIVGLFLCSARYNHNYFLWAVGLLTLSGGLERWNRWARIAGVFAWVPLFAHALVYNGVVVVNGAPYWALITTGAFLKPDSLAGPVVRRVLVETYLVLLATGGLGLLLSHLRKERDRAPRREYRWFGLLERVEHPARSSLRLAVASAVALTLLTAGGNSWHTPVTPESFGTYDISGARVIVENDFRGLLLDFSWHFVGPGSFVMNPSGTGTIALDTEWLGAWAYLERFVPDTLVSATMKATLARIDATPGFVQLGRVPGGWIGVREDSTSAPGTYFIGYFDEVAGRWDTIAPFTVGAPFTLNLTVSRELTIIEFAGHRLEASGKAPMEALKFGHTDAFLVGGGRLEIDEIEMSWDNPLPPPSYVIVAALLGTTAGALALPVWWWRRRTT